MFTSLTKRGHVMRTIKDAEKDEYLDENKKLLSGCILPQGISRQCKVNAIRLKMIGLSVYMPTRKDFESKFYKVTSNTVEKTHPDRRSSHMFLPSRLIKGLVSGIILNKTGCILATEPQLYGRTDYYLALLAHESPKAYENLTNRSPAIEIMVQLNRSDLKYAAVRGAIESKQRMITHSISTCYLITKDLRDRRIQMEIAAMKVMGAYSQAIESSTNDDPDLALLAGRLDAIRQDISVEVTLSPKRFFEKFLSKHFPNNNSKFESTIRVEPLDTTPPTPLAVELLKANTAKVFASSETIFIDPEVSVIERVLSPKLLRAYAKEKIAEYNLLKEDDLDYLLDHGMHVHVNGRVLRLVHVSNPKEVIALLSTFDKDSVIQIADIARGSTRRNKPFKKTEDVLAPVVMFDPLMVSAQESAAIVNTTPIIPEAVRRQAVALYGDKMNVDDIISQQISTKIGTQEEQVGALNIYLHSKIRNEIIKHLEEKLILVYAMSLSKTSADAVFPTFDEVSAELNKLVVRLIRANALEYQLDLEQERVLVTYQNIESCAVVKALNIIASQEVKDGLKNAYIDSMLSYIHEYCTAALRLEIDESIKVCCRKAIQIARETRNQNLEQLAKMFNIYGISKLPIPRFKIDSRAMAGSQSALAAGSFNNTLERREQARMNLHQETIRKSLDLVIENQMEQIARIPVTLSYLMTSEKEHFRQTLFVSYQRLYHPKLAGSIIQTLGCACMGMLRFSNSPSTMLCYTSSLSIMMTIDCTEHARGKIGYLIAKLPERMLDYMTMLSCIACADQLLKEVRGDRVAKKKLIGRLVLMCYGLANSRLMLTYNCPKSIMFNRLAVYLHQTIPEDLGIAQQIDISQTEKSDIVGLPEITKAAICMARFDDPERQPTVAEAMSVRVLDLKEKTDELSYSLFEKPYYDLTKGDAEVNGWGLISSDPFADFELVSEASVLKKVENNNEALHKDTLGQECEQDDYDGRDDRRRTIYGGSLFHLA